MVEIGIEILQHQLSEYLQRAREGERIAITDREGHPIAMLSPLEEDSRARAGQELVEKALARWNGKKPTGARNAPRVEGGRAAEIILEDRR
jgi:antitoxin (DNA-binding transcriptional repressor) of toxin-antitoxin stability system